MVNENREPAQATLPETESPAQDWSVGEESTPAPTDEQAPVDSTVETSETTEVSETTGTTEAAPPAAPSAETVPTATPPSAPEPTPQSGPSPAELQQLQRQAAEYEQLRVRAELQQESDRYQKGLEDQGYLPEQAQQAAQQYAQSRQAQADLMKKADEYGKHLAGKTAAAEHFAQKYKLNMVDLPTLRQAESPEIMEALAKNISERRSVDAELAKLRQAQAPPQSFDNSQGSPDVAPNDNGWLDRYNGGDRSTQAIAAARKAAGLS